MQGRDQTAGEYPSLLPFSTHSPPLEGPGGSHGYRLSLWTSSSLGSPQLGDRNPFYSLLVLSRYGQGRASMHRRLPSFITSCLSDLGLVLGFLSKVGAKQRWHTVLAPWREFELAFPRGLGEAWSLLSFCQVVRSRSWLCAHASSV